WVTTVILHLGGAFVPENALLAQVNAFFSEGTGFVSVEDAQLPRGWYGGTKYLEASLAQGAFNHLDLDALVAHLRTIEWPNPEDVQLLVREQEAGRFRIVNIFDDDVRPSRAGRADRPAHPDRLNHVRP